MVWYSPSQLCWLTPSSEISVLPFLESNLQSFALLGWGRAVAQQCGWGREKSGKETEKKWPRKVKDNQERVASLKQVKRFQRRVSGHFCQRVWWIRWGQRTSLWTWQWRSHWWPGWEMSLGAVGTKAWLEWVLEKMVEEEVVSMSVGNSFHLI